MGVVTAKELKKQKLGRDNEMGLQSGLHLL